MFTTHGDLGEAQGVEYLGYCYLALSMLVCRGLQRTSIRREVFINTGCLILRFNYGDGSVIVNDILEY